MILISVHSECEKLQLIWSAAFKTYRGRCCIKNK